MSTQSNSGTLVNAFFAFRNEAFKRIIELNQSGNLQGEYKLILRATCENTTNAIDTFVSKTNAHKALEESDFDWMMQLNTHVCVQELLDILDAIRYGNGTGDIVKAVDESELLEKLKDVIGGDDIGKYVENVHTRIQEDAKDINSFDEFVIKRSYAIYTMLKIHGVAMEQLSKENIQSLSEENYRESIANFVKICV